MKGPSEHSNKLSGSIKFWIILAQLAASQEGLSAMELFSSTSNNCIERLIEIDHIFRDIQ
jgi:hypothetical protein